MSKIKSSKLSYLGYAWTIIVNIITIIIVIAIFNSTYNSFESIIICIAILIYINLITFSSLWGWQKQIELFAFNEEFKKIRLLLKEKINEDDDEYEKEKLEKAKSQFKKQQVKFYINIVFAFIIYTITILKLLGSL